MYKSKVGMTINKLNSHSGKFLTLAPCRRYFNGFTKMDYKSLYKSRPTVSLSDFSAKLSQHLKTDRHEKRRELFWGSRVVLNEPPSKKPQVVDQKKNSRMEMLQKWKAEKMKKLEEEKKKQKPVFKVGIVQRKATGSPLISQPKNYFKKNSTVQQIKKKSEGNDLDYKKPGILTRSKTKKMASQPQIEEIKPIKTQILNNKCYKFGAGKKKQDSHVFRVPEEVLKLPYSTLTVPYSPNLSKCKENSVKHQGNKSKVTPAKVEEQLNNLPDEKVEKQNINLESQMVTPEKAEINNDDYKPIHYSPFVTVRSGKKSKRKSKSLTMNVDEQIEKEENEFKCRIFSFRKYIDCETKRLSDMCNKWKCIYREFQEVPADVEGDIDSVVGKTYLLTVDKFMQFKGLIDKCENGDPFVKIDDLQGFQDWVSIEVERIDEEFQKLEKRKCNNWKSETAPLDVIKVQKVKTSKTAPKKPVAKSNIRSHILAVRKLLKEGNVNGGETSQLPAILFEPAQKQATPKKKQSLLKDVLHSETKKKNESSAKKSFGAKEIQNSGLEIMIATQKNKFPTPVKLQKSPLLTDFEIFFGTEDTPSKSILKKTPKIVNSPKGHVTFVNVSENKRKRGLSEKYFRALNDDENSPMRTILGDLGNFAPPGMSTRSKTRQMSRSSITRPQNTSFTEF